MTLGGWFRDYVYIPLGGNRVGKGRQLMNILTVWVLTGLWHGAAWNFALWGLMFAILLILEKLWLLRMLNMCKGLSHLYVNFFVLLGFVLFDAESLPQAFANLGGLFGLGGAPLVSAESVYCFRSFAVILLAGMIGSTPALRWLLGRIVKSPYGSRLCDLAEPVVLVVLLLIVTAYLVDGSFNPFLYFRF